MSLLQVRDLSCSMGGVDILRGIDLTVDADEIVGIVGPNGAGKTSLFNAITGFIPCTATELTWRGESIQDQAPHRITQKGLVRTFQNAGGFEGLTIRENVSIACRGIFDDYTTQVCELLQLEPFFDRQLDQTTLATRKLVGVGMAALQRPNVIMLDEPLSGLDGVDRDAVTRTVSLLAERGVTPVLIEHDIDRTLRLATRMVVLDVGRKVIEGTPRELAGREELANVYLRS